MRIYWRYKDVPELMALSRSERREIVRVCFWKFGFRHWQCWVALFVFYLYLVALGTVAGIVAQCGLGLPELAIFACILIAVSIGSLIYSSVSIGQLRPHFRDYIAERKSHVEPVRGG